MSSLNNKAQVVYAAAVYVLGSDGTLTGNEKTRICEGINRPEMPWYIDVNGEDARWVHSMYSQGRLTLDEIREAVESEFNFSEQEKYQLYSCVCVALNLLSCPSDGTYWGKALWLQGSLGISRSGYNNWVEQ